MNTNPTVQLEHEILRDTDEILSPSTGSSKIVNIGGAATLIGGGGPEIHQDSKTTDVVSNCDSSAPFRNEIFSDRISSIDDLNVSFSSPSNVVAGLMTEPEPGEVVDGVQPPSSPSPPPSPTSISPTPNYQGYHTQSSHSSRSLYGEQQQQRHPSNSYQQSQHSNMVSQQPQTISSDHCYGLPYQDHNYGSAMSPALGGRSNHARSNSQSNSGGGYAAAPRTRVTVKSAAPIPCSFPSLAGPPPLERNSCSDEENNLMMDHSSGSILLSGHTLTPVSPVGGGGQNTYAAANANNLTFKSGSVTILPSGGITVCSSARPKIRRVAVDDASHSYASSADGGAGKANHPQKVAVFRQRRFVGAGGAAVHVTAAPPQLVSTSSTGAPTFNGTIVGPGLLSPIIPVTGNIGDEQLPPPPPKRPGRPRGARVGGQQQQPPKVKRQNKKAREEAAAAVLATTHDHFAATTPAGYGDMPTIFDYVTSPPPAAAHESIVPIGVGDMEPADHGDVSQSIESVLQSVARQQAPPPATTQFRFVQQQPPQAANVEVRESKMDFGDASVSNNKQTVQQQQGSSTEADFTETYRVLYDRLFKQVGIDEDDALDLDRPVGASRPRFVGARGSAVTVQHLMSPPTMQMQVAAPTTVPKEEVASNTDTDESSDDDEWAGQEYTTRCVCKLTHNDDLMIACDRCGCWQHVDCLGLHKKTLPEAYLCEMCEPRPLKLSEDEARKLQMRKLHRAKIQKQRRQRSSSSMGSATGSGAAGVRKRVVSSGVGRGRPRKNTSLDGSSAKMKMQKTHGGAQQQQVHSEETDEDFYANFIHLQINEYSNEVIRAIRLCGDSVGAGILDQVPPSPPCLLMYVTKERRGLVANATIPPEQPVMEFRGTVRAISEFNGRNKSGHVFPCVLFYRSLPKGGGVDGASPLDLCVDARYRGTEARFVRRSCQPNAQVKHVIKNDQMHLILVTTELIESATELTIPFDYDYRYCNYDVECACKIWGHDNCAVKAFAAKKEEEADENEREAAEKSGALVVAEKSTPKQRRTFNNASSGDERPSTTSKVPHKPSPSKKVNATASARKTTVGFKVKLKEKMSPGKKDAAAKKLHFALGKGKKRKMNKAKKKKLKPAATADLTRRRSSAASESEPWTSSGPSSPNLFELKAKSISLKAKVEESAAAEEAVDVKPNVEALKSDDEKHMSREEKKMQSLMEQIARMEEREKKVKEKRLSKGSEEKSPVKRVASFSPKPKGKRGRRPSSGGAKTPKSGGEDGFDAQAVGGGGVGQRKRRFTSNYSDASSSSDNDGMRRHSIAGGSLKSTIASSASVATTSAANVVECNSALATTERKNSGIDVERNVVKKRWLRQAMSEESVALVSPPPAMSIETRTSVASEMVSPPSQVSPPTSAPPLKKRKIPTTSESETMDLPPPIFNPSPSSVEPANRISSDFQVCVGDMSSHLSAKEAADQLLALTQQKNLFDICQPRQLDGQANPSRDFQPVAAMDGQSVSVEGETTTAAAAANFDVNVEKVVERAGTPVQDEIDVDESANPIEIVRPPSVDAYTQQPFANDAFTTQQQQFVQQLLPFVQQTPPAPAPRKKVKMSLDEYKKRKRDSVADGQVEQSPPDAESRDSQDSPAAAVVPPAPVAAQPTPLPQRAASFIPQIKEGEMETKTIRLSTLPDPALIGKTSATLDELRQRIYGRSFPKSQTSSVQVATATSAASAVESASNNETESNFATRLRSISPPESSNSATGENSSTPAQHRMSLMERLRMEFGLEDSAAPTTSQRSPQVYPAGNNNNNNPALAMIQNVRNSFRPPPPPPVMASPLPPAPPGPPPPEVAQIMNAMMGRMVYAPPPPPPHQQQQQRYGGGGRRYGSSRSSSSSPDEGGSGRTPPSRSHNSSSRRRR